MSDLYKDFEEPFSMTDQITKDDELESLRTRLHEAVRAGKALRMENERLRAGGDCFTHTCSGCRWWVEDEFTMAGEPQKECTHEKFLHESGWDKAGDPAESLTYEYYEGGQIWTGPNFGCIHFERNEKESMPESLVELCPAF